MRGAIQRLVEGPLAERILTGEIAAGQSVQVVAGEAGIGFVAR
jgi:ATP-dependent Clp protease ATP-binding subunit ClpC